MNLLPNPRLIISAPFGNYLNFDGSISTIGTFTLHPRPGRWMQVLRTVRHVNGSWVNKLGLRNPGIGSVLGQYGLGGTSYNSKIISVHGFTTNEWHLLADMMHSVLPQTQMIELNVSCPNVTDEKIDYTEVFRRFERCFPRVIVKLPPIGYPSIIDAAFRAQIKNFHCCNTIPSPIGGISGKPVMEYSIKLVAGLRKGNTAITIIGGGGITSRSDMLKYWSAGADYFAMASAFFNPMNIWKGTTLAREASSFNLDRKL